VLAGAPELAVVVVWEERAAGGWVGEESGARGGRVESFYESALLKRLTPERGEPGHLELVVVVHVREGGFEGGVCCRDEAALVEVI
jgi:hypothetical protein